VNENRTPHTPGINQRIKTAESPAEVHLLMTAALNAHTVPRNGRKMSDGTLRRCKKSAATRLAQLHHETHY
jgi:hypothetical protein